MSSEVWPDQYLEDNGHSATVVDLRAHNPLDHVQIVGYRDGDLIDCHVPAELIDHEEVPVKEEWARSLATEMSQKAAANGGTGQLVPIILGHIAGEPTLKIIDGFHRDAALRINGEQMRYATITHTTWDKLYDDRIFLAKDHVHVRFSRVVQWIREVWDLSGMADKLSVEQAVLLYRFDTDGSRLGLSPQDAASAKAWIKRKEEQWQIAAMTIHAHLKIAENVDPRLVHSTREKRNSRVLDAPTQVIIKLFSDLLPNDFPLQNLVMDVAMRHNLKGPQVKALCKKVQGCQNVDEAQAMIASIDPRDWEPEYGQTTLRVLRNARDPRHQGGVVLNRAIQDIQTIQDHVDNALVEGGFLDGYTLENLRQARKVAEMAGRDLAKLVAKLTVLIGDNHEELARTNGTEASRKDPFQVLLRAYCDGRIPSPPPITTAEQLHFASSLLEIQEFFRGRNTQATVLQDLVTRARARLTIPTQSATGTPR